MRLLAAAFSHIVFIIILSLTILLNVITFTCYKYSCTYFTEKLKHKISSVVGFKDVISCCRSVTSSFAFTLYPFFFLSILDFALPKALCVDIENFHSFILFFGLSVLFSGVDRVYIFAPFVTFDLQNAAKPVPNLVNTINKVKRVEFCTVGILSVDWQYTLVRLFVVHLTTKYLQRYLLEFCSPRMSSYSF